AAISYAAIPIGAKRSASAVSPRSYAVMMRANRRSAFSRGEPVSGGGVPDAPSGAGTEAASSPCDSIGATRIALSTSTTPPALYHGRFGFRFGEPPATAAPHWVQKRAPGTRLARHSRQRPGSSGAPHDGQNRPSDSVPQLAHFMRQNTAHPPGAGRGWRAYVG